MDIGQQRSVLALVPRSTVHKHYNPGRIFGLKEINFEGNEKFNFGNKARNIKKLNNIEKYLTNTKLGIKFKSGKQALCANTHLTKASKARNIKKLNNIEKYLTNTKQRIKFKSGKQTLRANTYLTQEKTKQGNTNWCEENKLKKLIVLNYTERGKQQKL